MKNKILPFLFSLFFSTALFAQSTTRLGQHDAVQEWTTVPVSSFTSTQQGKQIAQQIIDIVGLKPNFEIIPANIDNAAAVVYGGKRYILYNPTFINNLTKTTGTEWAAISVLAHEIGHHLNGHTVTAGGSQPAAELEADEFSGFVLRKMGASLAQSQAAMRTIADARASRTHPAQYDRLASIEKGWNHADDQIAGRMTPVKKTPETERPAEVKAPQRDVVRTANTTTVLNERYILGDVTFNAVPGSTFYVTTQYNLVKAGSNGISVLGKLSRTTSGQYPYLLSDDQGTKLWVRNTGAILTQSGVQVGLLRNHN